MLLKGFPPLCEGGIQKGTSDDYEAIYYHTINTHNGPQATANTVHGNTLLSNTAQESAIMLEFAAACLDFGFYL